MKPYPNLIMKKYSNLGWKTQHWLFLLHSRYIQFPSLENLSYYWKMCFAYYMGYQTVPHLEHSGFLWHTTFCLQVILSIGREFCLAICEMKLRGIRKPRQTENWPSIFQGSWWIHFVTLLLSQLWISIGTTNILLYMYISIICGKITSFLGFMSCATYFLG